MILNNIADDGLEFLSVFRLLGVNSPFSAMLANFLS